MDAATEFVYIELELQEAPQGAAGSNHPQQFADLKAANDRLLALPEEHSPDTVEIELDGEQMDALLAGRLVF